MALKQILLVFYLAIVIESIQGRDIKRLKRDVTVNQGPDDSYSVNAEKSLKVKDSTVSANAGVSGLKPSGGYETADAGVGILTRKGNSFSLSGEHNPKSGDTLAADAKVNLIKTDTTSLNAQANLEKFFPKSEEPVQTKFGGSLDYENKNGKSAILSAKHDSTFGDTLSASGKLNILNTDVHNLDARANWERQLPLAGGHKDSYGGSLDYLNKKPDSFFKEGSLSAQHIPDYADKFSAVGTANLFHNQNHNLDATGSFSRTLPLDYSLKNFNTYGGNLDYLYRDKIGASLGVKHEDLFKTTDYSAMGKFNLFKDKTTDFSAQAGLLRHDSPLMSGRFEPSFLLNFKKSF